MTELSNQFISQVYAQESEDPFLVLLTLTHSSFGTLRMVNNSEEIVSNSKTFMPFPFDITLPADDGEAIKDIQLSLDNVALELIAELRTVRDFIQVEIQLVLASRPNDVEIEIKQLQINSIEYNANSITATLVMDNFLGTELSCERYTPILYPGLFT